MSPCSDSEDGPAIRKLALRAQNRAADAAEDAADAIREGRITLARGLLAEAAHHLDKRRERLGGTDG